ncbi:SEFIR domain protein [Gilliamella apicola]|nr:SEFIR domain-containing protein [Gilliamella apicola]KFA59078.1 SEFIR domain protein [Gilliamella apicola]
MTEIQPIKAFISYSWSSPEHEQWVMDLAEQLYEDGVEIILDKWDLKEGYDKYSFMETMITDQEIKKVIIISDKIYAEKADQRTGGVGTETQIITPELYGKTEQNKFVIVTTQKDENGEAYIPTYYKSKIYIDLSDSHNYNENYERLLRWLFDKPVYQKPILGKPPAFLFDDNSISIGTKTYYTRCMNAIRDGKNNSLGCFEEYCNVVIENLERFRMNFDGVTEENPADEILYKNVISLLPVRDEILEIFNAILNYSPITEFFHKIHKFFEKIHDYNNIPKTKHSYEQYEVENYEIFNYQLFLYTVSLFIRYERFSELNDFLLQRFLLNEYGKKQNCSFVHFNFRSGELLRKRNERLSLHKISLLAHYFSDEWKHKTITHDEVIQAELLLFIFSRVKLSNELFFIWLPHNIGYLEFNTADIFIKAESKRYLNKFSVLLTINQLAEFVQQESKSTNFGMGYRNAISENININKLGTLN